MDTPPAARNLLNKLPRWAWVAGGVAVLVLLGVLAWWLWKRRGRMDIVATARTYVGVITSYSEAHYDDHTADCSEYLRRVLGYASKHHDGEWWGTDNIYDDAMFAQTEWARLSADEVTPGDIAVYPGATINGKHHSGHVAIVTDPVTHTIIDCSSSQNGVHEHVDLLAHFWTRPDSIFARFIGTAA